MSNTLIALTRRLDEQQPRLSRLDQYAAGEQPLAYLSADAREAIGTGFGRLAVNIPRVLVNALAERLRVTGFHDLEVAEAWARNDLDQRAGIVHREALTLGRSFVIVWADSQGRATATPESAHQVAVQRDPVTGTVTAAVKRWVADGRAWASLFSPESVTVHVSKAKVADPAALPATGWDVFETHNNPLGAVPVVPFVHADRLGDSDGRSSFEDALPLVDALNKTLADLMVGSEYYARPRRWATGVELPEDDNGEVTNPFTESVRMMIAEEADAKFGSLPAADLASYEAAVGILTAQLRTVTGLPDHYLGIKSNQPPSADALRATEAGLTARTEAIQAGFGRSWEQVARLLHAVENGTDPYALHPRVQWADPATRSVAQDADATVKLFSSGLLPADYALARLGYSAEEIRKISTARRAEALDKIAMGGGER